MLPGMKNNSEKKWTRKIKCKTKTRKWEKERAKKERRKKSYPCNPPHFPE